MAILTVTSISGPKKSQNLKISPVLQQKNAPKDQKNPHTWCGGIPGFNVLSSFSSLPLSCLSFSSFPLLLALEKPKSGPSNEVIGMYMFIYIYIYSRSCVPK